MSNILVGVGRAQFEVLDDRVEAKRTVLTRYEEVLGGIDGVIVHTRARRPVLESLVEGNDAGSRKSTDNALRTNGYT